MGNALDNLIQEFGISEITPAVFQVERARLVDQFQLKGIPTHEIDRAIRSGKLDVHSKLVQDWIDLHMMEPDPDPNQRPQK